MAVILEEQYC